MTAFQFNIFFDFPTSTKIIKMKKLKKKIYLTKIWLYFLNQSEYLGQTKDIINSIIDLI